MPPKWLRFAEGLKKFYGIDAQRALLFFALHEKLDLWHSRSEKEIILASAASLKGICRAAEKACRALWNFLDEIEDITLKLRMEWLKNSRCDASVRVLTETAN